MKILKTAQFCFHNPDSDRFDKAACRQDIMELIAGDGMSKPQLWHLLKHSWYEWQIGHILDELVQEKKCHTTVARQLGTVYHLDK